MKRASWLLALACSVMPHPASAYELMVNGSFETADLSGWQIFNQGSSGGQGSWYPHSSGNGAFSGLPTTAPASGSWQAVADNSGRAAAILYQDITIPATTRATLTFVLWYGTAFPYVNGSSLNPASSNQRVRVDIIQTTAGLLVTSSGVLQLVHASGPGSPSIFEPTTITANVTALAGQTVRLRAALVGTSGGIIAGIDHVRLDVAPFAPTTLPVAYDTGAARFADFDHDGNFEVSQMGSNGFGAEWTVARWNTLSSTWQLSYHLTSMQDGDMAAADIDGDGDLDLTGVGTTAPRVYDIVIHRTEGGVNFTSLQLPLVGGTQPGSRRGSIDWGDFDTDGDLDAVVTGESDPADDPRTVLKMNEGSGVFSTWFLGNVPGITRGNAAWAMLNTDDRLDLLVCGTEVSNAFLYDPTGFVAPPFGALPLVTDGAIAIGDLTGDGREDVVLTGLEAGTSITRVYRSDLFVSSLSWVEISAGLPGVHQSSVSLGDFDNDGHCDFAICGNTGAGRISRVYRNNGNETFTDINAALPGVDQGTVEFGDFDSDGDLDLLLQGFDGANRIARVYVNSLPVNNVPPATPTGLSETVSGGLLRLETDLSVSDDHTPTPSLTWNFRAGTQSEANDIIPSMSDPSSGRRRIPRRGMNRLFRTIPLTEIGHGSLYWSAQIVDQSYLGSFFAPERVFIPGPRIAQIQDVPGDQGGRVRLTLDRSIFDDESVATYPAAGYNVWRLVPPGPVTQAVAREGVALAPAAAARRLGDGNRGGAVAAASPRAAADAGADLPLLEWDGRLFTRSEGISVESAFPAGTWEIVGSFYATQQPTYLVASSTVADSGASGTNDMTFIVTVHTTTPSVWFASPPVSGHSVDNLAPGAPGGLVAAYHTGNGNRLTWQPAPEPDFEAFRVYRGTTPGFTAGPSNRVATVGSSEWTDPSHDDPAVFYRVSTLDHAGNESAAVAPVSTTATGAPDSPIEFALQSPSPNPFATEARIGFALPHEAEVRLEVFDVRGRRVRTLLDAMLPAGRHAAEWGGTDRDGRRVEAGVYFYRLRAGSFTATRRVTFLP